MRWALLLGALVAGAAQAQLLSADFESGGLVTSDLPPGPWDGYFQAYSGWSVATQPQAAHRGAQGLRLNDQHTGAGDGTSGFLQKSMTGQGDRFVRLWIRVPPGTTGKLGTVNLTSDIANTTTVELEVEPSSGLIQFGAMDNAGAQLVGQAVVDGGWHLVEHAGLRMGTAQGRAMAWVDGVFVGQVATSWSGLQWTQLTLGQHYGPLAFTGTMDVDDVRLDTVAPGSTLRLTPPASLVAGACAQGAIALTSSFDGGTVAAPYALTVQLSSKPLGLEVSSSPTCADAGVVNLPQGAASAPAYFRSTAAGGFQATAAHIDFLPSSVNVTVAPGGGAGGGGGSAGGGSAGGGSAGGGAAGGGAAGGGSAGGGSAGGGSAGGGAAGGGSAGGGSAGGGSAGGGAAGGGAAGGGAAGGGSAGGGSAGGGSAGGGSAGGGGSETNLYALGCSAGGVGAWGLLALALLFRGRRLVSHR